MGSEKGVTLISLLTYIAVLLTVMVIIGRITGTFNKNLDNIDSENQAASDFSKVNYCFLKETKNSDDGKNITACISQMRLSNNSYTFPETATETKEDISGTAIKFINSQNIISYINKKIYFNKTKICDNVERFNINYHAQDKAIDVEMTIDKQTFSQTYTFR